MTETLTPDRMMLSADGEFMLMRHVSDERWRWSWLTATAEAGVTVNGMSSYGTHRAALTAARAARKRLVSYCRDLRK